MLGRSGLIRTRTSKPENLGKNVLHMIANICLTVFVIAALVVTIIAATYEPDEPLFHSPTKITTFFTFASNSTPRSDNTVLRTGEDLMAAMGTNTDETGSSECEFDPKGPLDCKDPGVFQLMMQKAIERFKDIHFNRFGKPTPGPEGNTCDMAWRFRPKQGKATGFNKDYRRFVIERFENCTIRVVNVGDYHSGVNARKKKNKNRNQIPGFPPASGVQDQGGLSLPAAGDVVNDSLPVVESEEAFIRERYLIYVGGGDRCYSMKHYLWSFLCALGEAEYLKRTLVMDMTLCLSSTYTSSNQDEEGKDFRFYFDFEHLKQTASVLDQEQFWQHWDKWQIKDRSLYLVEDFRVSPKKLSEAKHSLIMRKFGFVEPDNYWWRVCEGVNGSVVQRPWHLIRKSRRLMDIVAAIGSKLNWDYDSVHIVRGDKARNRDLWPNLAQDTSPDALISTLRNKIEDGRNVYIATNEPETSSFFEPLKHKYATHFLNDYKELWNERSEWYTETSKLNNGAPVEFDGYMRASVDAELFLRGKKQIETFNDLTNDCKDGVNTCNAAAI